MSKPALAAMEAVVIGDVSPLVLFVQHKEDLLRQRREIEKKIKANDKQMARFIRQQAQALDEVRG